MKPELTKDQGEPLPVLPRWTSEERGLWLDLMTGYSQALLPSSEDAEYREEARARQSEDAVRLGARLADIAIEEMRMRVYSQSAGVDNMADGMEAYAAYRAWLEKTHRPLNRKKRVAVNRRR